MTRENWPREPNRQTKNKNNNLLFLGGGGASWVVGVDGGWEEASGAVKGVKIFLKIIFQHWIISAVIYNCTLKQTNR